jgi:hypothetical protein
VLPGFGGSMVVHTALECLSARGWSFILVTLGFCQPDHALLMHDQLILSWGLGGLLDLPRYSVRTVFHGTERLAP